MPVLSRKPSSTKSRSKAIDVKVRGYISNPATHGSGRSQADRQYFFINGRPCSPVKASEPATLLISLPLTRVVYRSRRSFPKSFAHFLPHHQPLQHHTPWSSRTSYFQLVNVLFKSGNFSNLTSIADCMDINVSPDKRTILLHGEDVLVNALRVSK